jgi:archaemetzincin
MILALAPVGRIDPAFLDSLGARLLAELPFSRVEPAEAVDPFAAHDPERGQFSSTALLRMLREAAPSGGKILGVTAEDLFVPVLTFVFGEADLGGTAAIFSLHRLRPEFYGIPAQEGLLADRAVKEALHEIGHTFGLTHCPQADCAMRASTNAGQVDLKPASFCPGCAAAIDGAGRSAGA